MIIKHRIILSTNKNNFPLQQQQYQLHCINNYRHHQRHHQFNYYILISILILIFIVKFTDECDDEIIYRSGNTQSAKHGSFSSPQWPNRYPMNVRCRYRFVALSNEKVRLRFHHFNLEALSDECKKDFLDIYIDVQQPPVVQQVSINNNNVDNMETIETMESISMAEDDELKQTLFGLSLGRFCGHDLSYIPNQLVSLGQSILLDFHTSLVGGTNNKDKNDDDVASGQALLMGFNGSYEFLSASDYSTGSIVSSFSNGQIQERVFLIDSANLTVGQIRSPTYPGLYPPYLNYTYLLRGTVGERIWITFHDLDLHSYKESCPYDYVLIFDGLDTQSAATIGRRFCGTKGDLNIYSTGSSITVVFLTNYKDLYSNPNMAGITLNDLQRRGFLFTYRFSTSLLSIDKNLEQYLIKGTECDLQIKSSGRSEGFLSSPGFPNHPVPPGKICNIYFYGLHNKQNMEIVEVNLVEMQMPIPINNQCSRGSLSQHSVKITFDRKRSTERKLFLNHVADRILCGYETPTLISQNPIMLLRFNTSQAPSNGIGGFRLKFTFKTDFGIRSGHRVNTEECNFQYKSSDIASGYINSPFYDRPYPSNSSCQYDFTVESHEYLRIVFVTFHTAEETKMNEKCLRDYIRISERLSNDGVVVSHAFCGSYIPGPFLSRPQSKNVIIQFYSDNKDTASGFKAFFEFIPHSSVVHCAGTGNITINDKQHGIIDSPHYPRVYPSNIFCEWTIKAIHPNNRIILHFTNMEMEGSPQSCANAVLNIYENQNYHPIAQFCGTDSAIPAFLSNSSQLVLRLITARSSRGIKGFRIVWTENIQNHDNNCPGFVCDHSRFCIARVAECDGVINCATYKGSDGSLKVDKSDEIINCPFTASYNLLHVAVGIVVTVIFLVVIVAIILYREHRRTHHNKLNDPLHEANAQQKLVPMNATNVGGAVGMGGTDIINSTTLTRRTLERDGCNNSISGGGGGSSGGGGGGHSSTIRSIPSINRMNTTNSAAAAAAAVAASKGYSPVPMPSIQPVHHPHSHLHYPSSSLVAGIDGTLTREKMQKISIV